MTQRILVVDDEIVTRRLVGHALKPLNVEVVGAEDGTSALTIARENEAFDLAIVDINLPDMDGFTVIRQLRGMPHLLEMPIILFTARSHPGDATEAIEVGAADLLYKPFSMQGLRDMVTAHLR
ncbi:MAG: response regulator [Chloroflexota bacterium]|nr:response regulator [Chloroflexota bacterium]